MVKKKRNNLAISPEIKQLIDDPENSLLMKKPFTRGIKGLGSKFSNSSTVGLTETQKATLPNFKSNIVSQETFLRELDPESHKVLFDQNIPSITQKTVDGNYVDIEYKKVSFPYQRRILAKDVLHLCGNKTEHSLISQNPSEKDIANNVVFKEYWQLRNQDGVRTKAVKTQKSTGDSGWLYYFNSKGEIQSRVFGYDEGYVLCPHTDKNGDTLLNSVYYTDSFGRERIDSYDDKYLYEHIKVESKDGETNESVWQLTISEHGFLECPLIIQRGAVAWDDAQPIIEVYEIIYNIFSVIMKRHGWGILYIKGQFDEKVKKLAGAVILQDQSIDGKGDANFKTPPNPEGMFNMLESLKDEIQIAASCTFILPKDISVSGDISGLAIQLTQSGDNEKAIEGAIEWHNAINKATRLFKYGLSKELVAKGINLYAVSEFSRLNIYAKIIPWMLKSSTETAQLITTMKGSGWVSQETAVEIGQGLGINVPNEKARLEKEEAKSIENELKRKVETINVNKNE